MLLLYLLLRVSLVGDVSTLLLLLLLFLRLLLLLLHRWWLMLRGLRRRLRSLRRRLRSGWIGGVQSCDLLGVEGRGGGWIPFECCNQRAYGHLRAVCLQR